VHVCLLRLAHRLAHLARRASSSPFVQRSEGEGSTRTSSFAEQLCAQRVTAKIAHPELKRMRPRRCSRELRIFMSLARALML